MANFTAGTSFSDGVTNDVTAAKLNALVADAVPTSNLSLNSTTGTIATFNSTTGTIATLNSTSGTIASLNSTTGTIATLNSTTGTIATLNSTTGTIATLNSTTGTIATLNSTTPTFLGAITASTNTINVGSGQIYKDASGNVGIGIASPTSVLDMSKASDTSERAIKVQNSSSDLYVGIEGTSGNRFSGSSVNNVFFGTTGASGIEFATNNNVRMTINSSGNVGIGTTSPINKLHLYNGTAAVGATQLELEGRFNGYGAGINFSSRTSDGGTLAAMAKITADGEDVWGPTGITQDAGLRFSTTQNGTLAERLRIDSSGNVIISGNKSLISNGAGGIASNTSIGSSALASNTTGYQNTASGLNALYSNTTGANNTASGYQALYSNTTGYYNTASGLQSLFSNTTGYQNTASGLQSLYSNTTGVYNTASGVGALYSNTTGYYNTASGVDALYSNTTGAYNTASGVNALYSNTTGAYNAASGLSALHSNTTGAQNTASGYTAGYGIGTNSNTTGSNNTFIGFESVGASATANNVITLGNGSIATLRCQVTSITALSDKRDKKDIENLSAGLDFVGKLRPVSFVWSTRDKAKVNIPDAGFIAQELLEVQEVTGITIPNLVSQENPEKLEAAYGTLIPVLVQAIKELKAKVESLEEKNK